MTRKSMSLLLGFSLLMPAMASAEDAMDRLLNTVPGNAIGFVGIADVKQLDADYQELVSNLGLQAFVQPPFNSLVSMIRQNMPMLSGLDENGPIAFVIMPAATLEELKTTSAIFIPAKDPTAMVQAFGATPSEGGVFSVNMMGQDYEAFTTETHVVAALTPDVVKVIRSGAGGIQSRLTATDRHALKGQDLAVWIDADKLMKLVKPMAEQFLNTLMAMQAAQGSFEAKSAEVNKKQIEMFLTGSATMAAGLSLQSEGLGLRFAMTPKTGSDLGKQFKVTNAEGSLLRGLPANQYLMAFGQKIDPTAVKESLDNIGVLFAMLEGVEGVDAEKTSKLRGQVERLMVMNRGLRGVIEGFSGGENGFFGISLLVDTTDSDEWLTLAGGAIQLCREMLNEAAAKHEDEDFKRAASAFTFEPEAEEIAKAKVRHVRFDLNKVAEGGEIDEDELEKVTTLIGKEGLLFRMAPADEKTVVLSFGGGREYFAKVLATTRSGAAALEESAGIKRVTASLPEKRASVFYLAVDHIIASIRQVQTAMDEEPLPIHVPDINAPLAMSTTGVGDGAQFDLFIPTPLMVAGKNAGMMMMGAQMAQPRTGPSGP